MKAIILTNAVRSFITLCSAVMIFISSIFGFGKSYSVENDYLIPLLKAMEKEDTEAIYDMFAADVTKSDKDLKRDIERLVKMYDGKLSEYDFVDGSTSDKKNKEKRYKKAFTASYEVKTSKETYMILISAHPKGLDKASTGMYSIALIRKADYDAENELEEYYTVRNGVTVCDRAYLPDLKKTAA